MYGRGNHGPQFGQGLQRPMPPYQQPPAGSGHLPASHFRPGQPFPIQQGGPHQGVPPRGSGYEPGPPNMAPQGPLGSGSNVGQSSLQWPAGYGAAPTQPPYLAGQPVFSSGAQNPHHVGPPPTPHSVGPRVLPPPPLQSPAGFGPPGPQLTLNTQRGAHHMTLPPTPPPPLLPQAAFSFYQPANFVPTTQQPNAGSQIPLPPPPVPSSSSPMAPLPPSSSAPMNVKTESYIDSVGVTVPSQMHESDSAGEQKKDGHGGGSTSVSHKELSLKQGVELPPPPPKPADDKVVRNIEVLCQYIAKNGLEFEERVRRNESGNPDFCFLVGGDPGSLASCAHEYYMWLKKKWGLQNNIEKGVEQRDLPQRPAKDDASAEPRFANVATVHTSDDSDVDMEDDIAQSEKEPEIYNLGEDLSSDPVSTGEVSETHTQETTLQHRKYNDSALQLSSPVKSKTMPCDSGDQPPGVDSPFRLIRNYASDDNSGNADETHLGKGTSMQVLPLHQSEFATSLDDIGSGDMRSKCDMAFKPKLPQLVTAWVDSSLKVPDSEAVQTESRDRLSGDSFSEIHGIDNSYGRAEPSNMNAAFLGECASDSRGADSVYCEVGREDKKSNAAAPKVDEFGRLIKEVGSDSESDGSRHVRWRAKRDRSRSRSRSPSDRRRGSRRRSLHRRDRRSRSRSWSPKRRRSRSRSPYRRGGGFNGEKLRRAIGQTPQCLDFLKGRCNRGASCRFLHHDVDKNEGSGRHKGRRHQPDIAGARNSGFGGCEYNDLKVEKNPFRQEVSNIASNINDVKNKAESQTDAVSIIVHEDVEKLAVKCENYSNENQVEGALEEPSSSAMHMSVVSPSRTSVTEPCLGKSNESTVPFASILNLSPQTCQLPPSPLTSVAENVQQELKGQVNHNTIPSSVSFPLQNVPVQSSTGYQGPVSTNQSHYPVPPNSEWVILPLTQQCPPNMVDLSISTAPLQYPQGTIPLRNDFLSQASLKAQPGEFLGYQVGGFQYQAYQLPPGNVPDQAYTGPNLSKDVRSSQFSSHDRTTFAPGLPPQLVPFLGDSTVKSVPPYSGSNMLVAESSKSTLYNQHTQMKLPPYGSSLTATDSTPSPVGGSLPLPGYAAESVDMNQPSHFQEVGGSRISTHYNPYASTFDQPLSTRFCSTVCTEKRETTVGTKYDGSLSLSSTPIAGQTARAYESRQITSSPGSSRAGGYTLPKSGGDQYDPLFDSIEPSRRAQKTDLVADSSDMLKVSSHQNILDVAENPKQKEIGAIVNTTSFENDEYGETADGEVGAVENGSSSDPDDDAIVAEGDIEIDQVKPEGHRKNSKDSRSMKLFKVGVANFVKDVLKPQWRQGNMSKEVFKTIVKKTVDKVSGAMKNHRLPKSQAKIDHYIDSSRGKLTQLVEGYVSKYKI